MMFFKNLPYFVLSITTVTSCLVADLSINQTDQITPIVVDEELPFTITVELLDTSLVALHSGAIAIYENYWLFIGGRTNGLHGFDPGTNNFPPSRQNTDLFVYNTLTNTFSQKSLYDPSSGLSQEKVDQLSVTSPQYYQPQNKPQTLYISGGYGVDTATGTFSTKPILNAIHVPGLINWVLNPKEPKTASQYIRQIVHPIFQVTGGYMNQVDLEHPTLLVFGQNFIGYYDDSSNGQYTEQVRRFWIHDDGVKLSVDILPSKSGQLNENYRRRDLNVVPVILREKGQYKNRFIAFSGVFTLAGGIWTVPVKIDGNGDASMADPNKPTTFKQGMNNYVCPTIGLFSRAAGEMYTVFCGGLSYGFFQNEIFTTDAEVPFINQMTAIKIDKKGQYSQYLLDATYPTIQSENTHPGNPLLFGAGAYFIQSSTLPVYNNNVINLDAITESTVIGYIFGGIQSTVPNTTDRTETAASPYIFRVIMTPRNVNF